MACWFSCTPAPSRTYQVNSTGSFPKFPIQTLQHESNLTGGEGGGGRSLRVTLTNTLDSRKRTIQLSIKRPLLSQKHYLFDYGFFFSKFACDPGQLFKPSRLSPWRPFYKKCKIKSINPLRVGKLNIVLSSLDGVNH